MLGASFSVTLLGDCEGAAWHEGAGAEVPAVGSVLLSPAASQHSSRVAAAGAQLLPDSASLWWPSPAAAAKMRGAGRGAGCCSWRQPGSEPAAAAVLHCCQELISTGEACAVGGYWDRRVRSTLLTMLDTPSAQRYCDSQQVKLC